MKRILFLLLVYSHCSLAQEPIRLRMTEIARGFISPIGLTSPHDGSNRLFIMEQGGKIKIIADGKTLQRPFLDISGKLDGLNIAYSEKGLLGLAFHPDYKTNGHFYIYYSAPTTIKEMDHKSIVAEYSVSPNDPNLAVAGSERVLLEIQEPESNHNGGQLAFGADGYLYIGVGDGGGAGDKHGEKGNGQNLETLLGKILRIDVNNKQPYAIPADNPFSKIPNAAPEIWAYGLRNPWRFSFDRANGRLFCGDVGQNKYEEINIIDKGKNYGWRIMEAAHCFDPATDCNQSRLTLPIAEYEHREGVCVIGGYMYRGTEFPSLHGHYLFGDWNGVLWYLKYNDTSKEWYRGPIYTSHDNNEIDGKINSFGEDENGAIYIVTQKLFGPKSPTGVIYKIGY